MADDWDLYAVVRSCTTARTAGATSTATSKTESENPLASLIFEDDDTFCFPNLEQPRNSAFEELNQFYQPFFPAARDASFSNFGGFELKSPFYAPEKKKQRVQDKVSSASLLVAKQQTPCVQQQREAHHQGIREEAAGTSASMLPMLAPPPQISTRPRKRKSQQKKMVCEVTAENLSSDMWAWRKYGQKPIKGSPYPRNYYKCSTSKGCSARKQVEKSTTDPNIFVVTYTGDHTHPRPVHRNSLAGSTRNKFTCALKSGSQDSDHPNNNPSCSSPLSIASFSPRTPLTSPVDEDPAKAEGHHDEAEELDEDDLLIPNKAMTEDIFMGLQELGYGGSGFRRQEPKPEPSWTVAADV